VDVEFYAPDDEQKEAVAGVSWDGREVAVTSEDAALRDELVHAFRKTPIAVDDASLRRLGTSGPAVIQPGSLEWFRAVAGTRATEETGFASRVVATEVVSGWDPAGNYRPFGEQIEKLDERSRD
jgi:hypothetical protein